MKPGRIRWAGWSSIGVPAGRLASSRGGIADCRDPAVLDEHEAVLDDRYGSPRSPTSAGSASKPEEAAAEGRASPSCGISAPARRTRRASMPRSSGVISVTLPGGMASRARRLAGRFARRCARDRSAVSRTTPLGGDGDALPERLSGVAHASSATSTMFCASSKCGSGERQLRLRAARSRVVAARGSAGAREQRRSPRKRAAATPQVHHGFGGPSRAAC